ncbi:MAG: aldehyde dehydrogenase family protein, partial [Planctomycetes bacterium]|nr:aldehyde dehydrogenase family protein [Planctomycetota bacterium]
MTPNAGLEESVAACREGAERLAKTSPGALLGLIERLKRDTLAAAEAWATLGAEAKGLEPSSPPASEEWLGGPVSVLRHLRSLGTTLSHIDRTGEPLLRDSELKERRGSAVASIFPETLTDRLVLGGFTAEVWMEQGLALSEVRDATATIWTRGDTEPRVAAVLGAGNVSSIGAMDVLHKVFAERQACVLKLHPVNAYLEEPYRVAFAALIEEGWLRMIAGGADVGAALVHHEDVDTVHITGSGAVHDAIVWGPPEVCEANKAAGKPVLEKEITSELGCVTPVVLVPGDWSRRELDLQARNVATQVVNNASFNCNAAKVLVTASDWPQRDEFLAAVRANLARTPSRLPYYPGSEDRYERFESCAPTAERLGAPSEGHLPWLIATDLDSQDEEAHAFQNEAWCGVLAETTIEASDPADFMTRATAFCNDVLFGTLSMSLVIDPRTKRRYTAAYEAALRDLRYGSVVVNHWGALSYALVVTPWGAHPGHPLTDIQSGRGFVHNTRLFDRVQKAVVEGPFAPL